MRTLLAAAWLGTLALIPVPALAWTHGKGQSTTGCPQGSATADGCVTALAGLIQHSAFFTSYAYGSDISARRPPWNVAGVDYGVGQITADASLADATINANLPSGCSFNSGADTVVCNGSGALILAHLSFTKGGAGTRVYISGTYTSITLFDDHFMNGSASDNSANLIRVNDSNASPPATALTVQNVTFDGNGYNYGTQLGYLIQDFRSNTVGNTTSITYSACINIAQKCWGSMQKMNEMSFNYFESFEHAGTNVHQETYILANGVISPFIESFNTFLQPSTISRVGEPGTGTVAFSYLSDGQANFEVQSATISNDTYIASNVPSPVGSAISVSYGQYDSLTFTNNYVYMPSAPSCFGYASNPTGSGFTSPLISGNVNMVNGASITRLGSCP